MLLGEQLDRDRDPFVFEDLLPTSQTKPTNMNQPHPIAKPTSANTYQHQTHAIEQ